MPKNKISDVMDFKSKKLDKALSLRDQGTLLSDDELKELDAIDIAEYKAYVNWVHSRKGRGY